MRTRTSRNWCGGSDSGNAIPPLYLNLLITTLSQYASSVSHGKPQTPQALNDMFHNGLSLGAKRLGKSIMKDLSHATNVALLAELGITGPDFKGRSQPQGFYEAVLSELLGLLGNDHVIEVEGVRLKSSGDDDFEPWLDEFCKDCIRVLLVIHSYAHVHQHEATVPTHEFVSRLVYGEKLGLEWSHVDTSTSALVLKGACDFIAGGMDVWGAVVTEARELSSTKVNAESVLSAVVGWYSSLYEGDGDQEAFNKASGIIASLEGEA